LKGLKENLIIGKLIPAGTGLSVTKDILFKNLPVEVETVQTPSEDLFNSAADADSEVLNELEEELFMKSSSVAETEDDEDDNE